jgi:putative phosphoesterase
MATTTLTVGVISDTHGLLRPEALDALRGADQILHAGDVGAPDILAALKAIAPTTAVRGNVDHGVWATALPMTDVIRLGDLDVFMLHDLGALDLDPVAAGFAAVITGHSHQPKAEWKRGVLYLNPGSAGPRRFTLPVTLSILRITGGTIEHERIDLLA